MYYKENRSVKDIRLFVIWKLLDDYVSVKEHKLCVRNYLNPQIKDLQEGIKEILPHLEKDEYSLYCRYRGNELYQITDYMSMITAFRIMEAHDSPLLYLIRKDIGEWASSSPELMKNPQDIKLILENCPDERLFSEIHRGRPEHFTDKPAVAEQKKKEKGGAGGKAGGSRKSMSRKSMSRKSKSGSGSRKSMTRKSVTRKSVSKK